MLHTPELPPPPSLSLFMVPLWSHASAYLSPPQFTIPIYLCQSVPCTISTLTIVCHHMQLQESQPTSHLASLAYSLRAHSSQ